MKCCDYCGKEISYFDQYCCEDCKLKAEQYFQRENKQKGIFGICSIIGVIGCFAGGFLGVIVPEVGLIIFTIALFIIGTSFFLFPLPVLNFVKKYKIKKAVKITKYIGAAFDFIALILLFIFCFKLIN